MPDPVICENRRRSHGSGIFSELFCFRQRVFGLKFDHAFFGFVQKLSPGFGIDKRQRIARLQPPVTFGRLILSDMVADEQIDFHLFRFADAPAESAAPVFFFQLIFPDITRIHGIASRTAEGAGTVNFAVWFVAAT